MCAFKKRIISGCLENSLKIINFNEVSKVCNGGTMKIKFYTKENCSLCDKGMQILMKINKDIPFAMEAIDIYKDEGLLEKYQIMIPVVEVDGVEVDYGILSEEKIRVFLSRAI